ncbi:MAG TPA: mechanosensitive ion channel family protein [Candidatus Acidoferrales bacterium]|nr:mechanosensitive ion channel family protein [Candidatus Acidoferrales bacterium]
MNTTVLKRTALWVVLTCLLACVAVPANAQVSNLKALAINGKATTPTPTDPLGRTTPRATLINFMQAAQRGDTGKAIEFLQVPHQYAGDREKFVQDLQLLLDRAWVGHVTQVSDSPEPSYSPSLPENHERAGVFNVQGKEVELQLVRVDDPNGHVWLIAWSTLLRVGDLASEVQAQELEGHMPRPLVQYSLFDLPLWVWLVFVAAVPIALLAGWIAVLIVRAPVWVLRKFQHHAAESITWNTIRLPVVMFATAFAHVAVMSRVRTPLLFRIYYGRVLLTVLIIAAAWLAWDLVSAWTRRTHRQMSDPNDRSALSLVLLGHRLLKAGIAVVAVIAALANMGVDLTTALAGVGLGGIVVALAAQKTIENLFGGVSVLTDRVIRVGDYCRIGDKAGTVEDIGLRSTRLRTVERTQVSIPNGALANVNVENLSLRDKILIQLKIGLHYETTATQLQVVLAELRAMLYAHPKIETKTARVRLIGLADNAFSVELFAYGLTREYEQFLAIQEDVLLRVTQIVSNAGATFAFPSRTLYVSRDSAPDDERIAHTEALMEKWKAQNQVPFPDYAPESIAQMSDTIEYPPAQSAVKPRTDTAKSGK